MRAYLFQIVPRCLQSGPISMKLYLETNITTRQFYFSTSTIKEKLQNKYQLIYPGLVAVLNVG